MSTNIVIIPRATEKAYGQSIEKNVYVFNAPLTANKQQIVAAVEAKQFASLVVNVPNLVTRLVVTAKRHM
jgi:ribosomal protein L23